MIFTHSSSSGGASLQSSSSTGSLSLTEYMTKRQYLLPLPQSSFEAKNRTNIGLQHDLSNLHFLHLSRAHWWKPQYEPLP